MPLRTHTFTSVTKYIFVVIFLVLGFSPISHAAKLILPIQPVTIPTSTQFDMVSKSDGRAYRIFVAWPPSPAKAPAAGYPVVYVLDANAWFGTAVESARMGAAVGEMKPAVIVGIGYPTDNVSKIEKLRMFDLTPPISAENRDKFSTILDGDKLGGAEQFYAFITEELKPKIAAMFSVNPHDENLFGHSAGGLFVLDVLFKHPNAFRCYVAASPSIWWNNLSILKDEPAFAHQVQSDRIAPRTLITVGGLEQTATPVTLPPGLTPAGYAVLLKHAAMIDNARTLATKLEMLHGAKGYLVGFHVFSGETHTNVVSAAIARGLEFVLGPSS